MRIARAVEQDSASIIHSRVKQTSNRIGRLSIGRPQNERATQRHQNRRESFHSV
jgi:hypothetical protein